MFSVCSEPLSVLLLHLCLRHCFIFVLFLSKTLIRDKGSCSAWRTLQDHFSRRASKTHIAFFVFVSLLKHNQKILDSSSWRKIPESVFSLGKTMTLKKSVFWFNF